MENSRINPLVFPDFTLPLTALQPPQLATPTEGAPATAATPAKTVKIAKYSWSDSNKSVKVYIDWAGADALPEGAVQAGLGEGGDATAAQLTVHLPRKDGEGFCTQHKLLLTPLYEPVSKVTAKCSAKRITLTLHKVQQFGWPDLKAKKK